MKFMKIAQKVKRKMIYKKITPRPYFFGAMHLEAHKFLFRPKHFIEHRHNWNQGLIFRAYRHERPTVFGVFAVLDVCAVFVVIGGS